MRRVTVGLAIVAAAVVAAGCTDRASSANRQFDPALRAASMVMALERTTLPVTKDQAVQLLPLFKAMRGTPAGDRPATDALVAQIGKVLTDAQRDALRRMQSERRERRPGAQSGSGGPGGFGPGPGGPGQPGTGAPSAERLAAFRGQLLDRAITLLETRVQ